FSSLSSLMLLLLPSSTLFPYTTLFRSSCARRRAADRPRWPTTPADRRDAEPPPAGYACWPGGCAARARRRRRRPVAAHGPRPTGDRKSTRLNSSHLGISYAVFCLKKKK